MKETNVATKLAAKDSEGEEASEEEALENSDISFKLMETVLMSGQEVWIPDPDYDRKQIIRCVVE